MLEQGLQAWSLKQLVKRLATVQAQVKDGWKYSPLAEAKQFDEIGPGDRDRIVKWLMQLTLHFQFYPDTFFLSVNLLDRFITSVKAHPKYLRCIAITCLYLASKMVEEEEIIPCTKDLIETSQCGCRTGDVLRMERIILEKLQWDLCTATSLQYLHVFHAIAVATGSVRHPKHAQRNLQKLTHALVRVVSRYDLLTMYPSSVLALAVFSVDLEESCNNEWVNITLQMRALANLDMDVVMECRSDVRRYVLSTRPMSNLQSNSAFVLNVPNLTNNTTASSFIQKESSQQMCGKRKASCEMMWQEMDGGVDVSKKVYTSMQTTEHQRDNDDDNDADFDDVSCEEDRESDATLTASEGEDEEDDDVGMMDENEEVTAENHRIPTYAEIVKLKGPLLNSKGRSFSPQPPPLVYHHDDDDDSGNVGNEDSSSSEQATVENCTRAAASTHVNAMMAPRRLATSA